MTRMNRSSEATTLREVVSRPHHTDTKQTEDDRRRKERSHMGRQESRLWLFYLLCVVGFLLFVFMTFDMAMTGNVET